MIIQRPFRDEDDYWRIRNFLREVFELNGRREHSWHVARLDYWRWHFILNCHLCEPVEKVTSIWETAEKKIVAVLNPLGSGDIRLHIHPNFRSAELEGEILYSAEVSHSIKVENGRHVIYLPVDCDDIMRQDVLLDRGFVELDGISHKWRRDLSSSIPETSFAPGYSIRSMGDLSEHPARSWASWRSFHADEPEENYDRDWTWYQNIQSAPLYRRDLDIVAISPLDDIAAFATIYYDDFTRSAVCVLVGTAVEHQRRGLGKAILMEGFRRLKKMGCARVFATAYDPPAYALYRSVMDTSDVAITWRKEFDVPEAGGE